MSSKTSPQIYTAHENLEMMKHTMPRYNDWIFSCLEPHLGQSILEAGCGVGTFTQRLLQHGKVLAVDIDPAYVESAKTELGRHDGLATDSLSIDDPKLMNHKSRQFDTIVCLNVLEHVREDLATLRQFHELLVPGGKAILQVPAFQWLYGTVDETSGHYRRYTKKELGLKLAQTGFEIVDLYYLNIMGMFQWFFWGKVLKIQVQSSSEMSFMDRFVPLLRWTESCLRPPMGISVIAVGRKKASP
ncbi:MAG: hypothetical protein A3G41_02230 [Elusimicrobia bacterium RIFCSPLOWO2_12_FULL_59_9]|nr:MAG: hypothetical protein A3G41_02230 [Elusimicrobia bacterium RIFCSPLOWO2_12_FULL_59_9]